MIKIFKNHFSLYALTTAVLFSGHNISIAAHASVPAAQTGANAAGAKVLSDPKSIVQNGKSEFSCNAEDLFFWCDGQKTVSISNKTYKKTKENTKEAAIKALKQATFIEGRNITIQDSPSVGDSEGGFWQYGIVADDSGYINIEEGSIDFTNGTAFHAGNKGRILLKNFSINRRSNPKANVDHRNKNSAFQMFKDMSTGDFINGKMKVADIHGIILQGNDAGFYAVESDIIVEGDASYGFYFRGGQGSEDQNSWISYVKERVDYLMNGEDSEDRQSVYLEVKRKLYSFIGGDFFGNLPETDLSMRGANYLSKTSFEVPDSVAIYSNKSGGLISLMHNSKISGDLLLKGEQSAFMKVSADGSELKGGVHLDKSSTAEFLLKRGSKWTLLQPKNRSLRGSVPKGESSLSLLQLIDSSVVFEEPKSNIADSYQTLRVGKGAGEVYRAQGNAHIYLNTYLNTGGDLQNQKTDRLLIHGDVEGKTTVHVQDVAGSPGGDTGFYGNNKGISLVQVSGRAKRDSFELDGGYVALGNSPYQYRLRPYGPESNLGKADPAQRLVEGEGEFWDFRFEGVYIDSDTRGSALPIVLGGGSHSKPRVRAVVPQVPTYLSLPNSMFLSGLVDINNQNKQLGMLRTTSSGVSEIGEKPALYLHSYGSSFRYASDLSALEYGYESDLSYSGAEAGMLLQTIESDHSSLSFGVMGSYGKLSLQPLDVEQSQKSSFDKWMATAYGSLQHDGGFYVDGLVSYGLLKGDVNTLLRGKTATLKGQPFSVSLTGGQTFATGYEGFVFDPQTQVIYQHVRFDKASDIDGFAIEMGNLDQWIARFGGRLIKTPKEFDRMGTVSFYGQLYFLHGFGGKQTVRFKDDFQLSSFGSSLEAGFGFNARLSGSFALHGDFTYQHKLSKAGFSGTSFSGGLRYHF